MAQRQGLSLSKSRRRDPRSMDYAQWSVTRGEELLKILHDLDEVEAYLTTRP